MEVSVQTEDGHTLQVPADLLPFITLVSRSAAVSSTGTASPIVLAKVRAATFSKVLEWCSLHRDDETVLATIKNTPKPMSGKRIKVKLDTIQANPDDDDTGDEGGAGVQDEEEEDDQIDIDDAYSAEALERDMNIAPIDKKFIASLEIPALIDLTSAANYLSMDPLLDTCCKAIAKEMSGLSVEELRIKFNIQNDFTPEEETKLKAEFGWADE